MESVAPGFLLDHADLVITRLEGAGKQLVYGGRIVSLDEQRLIPMAAKPPHEVSVAGAAVHGRPGDLVAVEMQNGKHGAIADRVEELVALPASFQRTGFGFAVSDDAHREQVGVVEDSAVRVQQ